VPITAKIYVNINNKRATNPTLGNDIINESIIFLNAGMTVIILRTLIILSSLATNIAEPAPTGIRLKATIIKSKMFHPSLKNLPNDFSDTILTSISNTKKIVIT